MVVEHCDHPRHVGTEPDRPEVATTVRGVVHFDYSGLTAEHADAARSAAERIRARTSAAILDTGRDLIGIKTVLDHGQFERWLRAEFGMTPRTAQNYMRAATLVADKSETVSYLPAATVYEIARSPAAVQDQVLAGLASGEISADQVRPALRATVRELRLGDKVGARQAEPPQIQAQGSGDREPSLDADVEARLQSIVSDAVTRLGDLAATILDATRAGPDADNHWAAFCRALRVGLEQAVTQPAPATPVTAWQNLRDTAFLSPTITQRQRAFLATLGTRGPPTEEQLAKLHHIAGTVG